MTCSQYPHHNDRPPHLIANPNSISNPNISYPNNPSSPHFIQTASTPNSPSVPSSTLSPIPSQIQHNELTEPPTPTPQSATSQDSAAASTQALPTHPMITCSKNGIYKPKQINTVTKFPLPTPTEPSCPSQAIKLPEWKNAMSDEFNALLANGTWSLVPPTPSQNVIGCKWVFRLKRHTDGSIARYKARLVAKGFHQQPGIDYTDTFSPVVKPQTIKVVICLALSCGWPLSHMDVNNAFLNGTISEDIYMSQPYGFVHPQFPNHICKLNKALYGLKQAPQAWYQALRNFLLDYGFSNAKSDTSLFIYTKGNIIAYFLVYVDDILLTGNDDKFLSNFQEALANKFSFKNLGTPSHFLGIEFLPTEKGLFLTQHHYIRDLLQNTNMHDAKLVCTPMSTTCSLHAPPDPPLCDVSTYRKIIGSLQYLALTRPDISFSVNRLSQHLNGPSHVHM